MILNDYHSCSFKSSTSRRDGSTADQKPLKFFCNVAGSYLRSHRRDGEGRCGHSALQIVAINRQVCEALALESGHDMKRQHHAISPPIVAPLFFNQNIAVVSSNNLIDEESLHVNPVANSVLGIKLNFHNIVVAFIFLSCGD